MFRSFLDPQWIGHLFFREHIYIGFAYIHCTAHTIFRHVQMRWNRVCAFVWWWWSNFWFSPIPIGEKSVWATKCLETHTHTHALDWCDCLLILMDQMDHTMISIDDYVNAHFILRNFLVFGAVASFSILIFSKLIIIFNSTFLL